MRKKYSLILVLFVCAELCLSLSACDISSSPVYLSADISSAVYINEVVSSNAHSLIDEQYGTPDWVELYNSSDKDVSLSGYGLTDNIKNPMKWSFPDITIKAHSYLIVYAAKQDGDLFTGFALSKRGDMLYLSDNYYNLLSNVELPTLLTDVSYARTADGKYGYCLTPTPNAQNSDNIVFSEAELINLYNNRSGDAGSLVISEVMPENKATLADSSGSYYPWAELYNSGDSHVNLSAYFLSDDKLNATKFQLPDMVLQGGERIVVFLSGGSVSSTANIHTSFKLGSNDDTLYLFDDSEALVSSIGWHLGLPDDISVLPNGVYTAFPTPYEQNSSETFTNTEKIAMDSSDPVRLNEILVRNKYSVRDKDGDRSSFIELYNSSATVVSLLGYYLSDDTNDPYKWAFPDVTIAPNGYLVIFASGKDVNSGTELHTSFNLSANDNAAVLSNKNGLRCDEIMIDSNIKDNVSIGRGDNESLYYFTTPTPGAENASHAFSSLDEVCMIDTNGVYITEVCAANAVKSGLADWIELYNASSNDINLEGWYLSDDVDDPFKFALPSLTIDSGGYATINATTRTSKQSNKSVFVTFGISDSGETLILSKPNGEIADIFETGALRNGVTSGRLIGNDSRVFFLSASKGSSNSSSIVSGFVIDPVFSDITLYHTEAFQLEITCRTENAAIYYTLDGSKPTSDSIRYTSPIEISKNTPVRAVAICDGLAPSEIITNTYLFVEPHTLPVVCISANQTDFDEMYAVTDRWKKIEREAYISYYESDGRLGISFPCGLKAAGASTLLAAQKSMSVMLRTGYGMGEISYPFFEDSTVDTFSSLVLRDSGQDRFTARLRDSYFMKAVKGLNIDYVETRLTVVYINGSYWGIYDLNENQNEDYLASHYGADPDAVDIIRRNETRLEGDKYEMKRVREYALNTDLSDDTKFAEYTSWVDEDYFIDYLIAQTYFANGDMFNQKYWRSQDYSVKWRPVFFDLDLGFSSSSPTRNILSSYFKVEGVPSRDGSITNMDLYVGLRKNAAWCDKFCERYVYVVINYFTADRLCSILDEMVAQMEPEMPRFIERWSGETPRSMDRWHENVAELRDCLSKRSEYALKYLKNEFSISDEKMQEYMENATLNGATSVTP